jgi:probable rRNA maturation factor
MIAEPDPEPDPVTVVASDETTAGVDDPDRWSDIARETLEGESVPTGRLDLIFVDTEDIAVLNRDHMSADGPTDVLAFPIDGPTIDGPPAGEGGAPVHLGDVVICPDVARRQAPGHCGSYEAEMALLVVHGVLHILGHDHAEPDETTAMRSRERHHLDRYGLVHPVPA